MSMLRVAIVSTFAPRQCGIATFSADLRGALMANQRVERVDVLALASGDEVYDEPVAATVRSTERADYAPGAEVLGSLGVDVVMIEHEFGIFGGVDGEMLLEFTGALRVPYAVTLHTVLRSPTESQRRVLADLCRGAGAVLVFTELARNLVVEQRIAEPDRVHVVPHGAPQAICDVATRSARPLRLPLGTRPSLDVSNRFVVSSFGLLSPGKGLETVIDSVAKLVPSHPELLLVIAGRTHPEVARHDGERYRLGLVEMARGLGIDDHVVFDDRFLAVDELAELLAVTDVYVTAYPSSEQIVSGTLTFALAAGRAVVSTPYLYAVDVLGGGTGRLSPFGDAATLAGHIEELLEHPDERERLCRAATRFGAGLTWSAVGEATASILDDLALHDRRSAAPSAVTVARPSARVEALPPLCDEHLRTLVDDVGIIQHARGTVPHRVTGYCVDDVARLVQVARRLELATGDRSWWPIVQRGVAFLWHAAANGDGMHNFMSYERCWIDEPSVGDHVGRSVWALGDLLASHPPPSLAEPSNELLAHLCDQLTAVDTLPPRTAAYSLLGLARVGRDERLVERMSSSLVELHRAHRRDDWEWFEPTLTYDNARLSQSLIVAGVQRGDPSLTDVGLRTLAWLGGWCSLPSTMVLPGNADPPRRHTARGAGDEQPLDAAAIVEAELDALSATGSWVHAERAVLAFAWFTGRNRCGVPVYDAKTGGCHDGLTAHAVNANEGAESTLAYHTARLAIEAAGLMADPAGSTRPRLVA
jgi:glycosyltransferase involved in cell wall biosynthesis